jgi:hypothetical protein
VVRKPAQKSLPASKKKEEKTMAIETTIRAIKKERGEGDVQPSTSTAAGE